MKRLIVATSVAAVLTGCGTFGGNQQNSQAPIPSPTPAVTKDQTVAAPGKLDAPPTIDIPAWYIKAPASTEDYVFISGTGVSSDLSMSRTKALLDAQVQLADKINGVINALAKQNRTDNAGTVSSDRTSQTVKKLIMDTAITGYHLEDSRVLTENRNYRTFVLIRYPMGDANRLLKDKLQRESQSNTSEDAAQDELERELNSRRKPAARSESAVQVQPISGNNGVVEVRPAAAVSTGPVDLEGRPVTKLMEISNPEVRAIRDAAAARPGAIVESVTVQ